MNSRDKGARLEREAAHALNRTFGRIAQRLARNGVEGAGDLQLPLGLHGEVKGRKSIASLRFSDQAEADAKAGNLPFVLMRENGGPWYVQVRLEHLAELAERLVDAGEGVAAIENPVYPPAPGTAGNPLFTPGRPLEGLRDE